MIFSLNTGLKKPMSKLVDNGKPISYSWGDIDALHKWLEAQNKKASERALGINNGKKYPLIWLTDSWKAEENVPGLKFNNVTFYIAKNSKVETLNENRVPNFDNLYQVGNDMIKELKRWIKISDNSIKYYERANLSVKKSGKSQSYTHDIWDAIVIEMDIIINTNCIKKLCSS